MKKLLWPLCVITVILSAAGLGFLLAYQTEELTYDQIVDRDTGACGLHVDGIGIPVHVYRSIRVLHEGDYLGLSDTPVPAERAAPGRAALNALQSEKYTRPLPFVRPAEGGVALREISGCSTWYIAYWDGKYLWLPGKEDDQWRGFLPSDPSKLSQILESLS